MDCLKYREYLHNTENNIISDYSEFNPNYEEDNNKYFDDEYDNMCGVIANIEYLEITSDFSGKKTSEQAFKYVKEHTEIFLEKYKNRVFDFIHHYYMMLSYQVSFFNRQYLSEDVDHKSTVFTMLYLSISSVFPNRDETKKLNNELIDFICDLFSADDYIPGSYDCFKLILK